MRSIKWFTLLLLSTLALASCGFHLRTAENLPGDAKYLHLESKSKNMPLIKALNTRMSVYRIEGGTTLPSTGVETIKIALLAEDLDRRLLSVFSTGQVAEYELIYSVRYHVLFPNGHEIKNEFEVLREYQDDPDEVLAKSRELNLVLSEMRLVAADRIIRLLSSQYPQS